MTVFFQKNEKKLIALLWTAAILASIKSILTDTGFDNSYMVAMSFRHLKGDGMFEQMWEPHQTSVFFTDIFMWLYRLFVPSYTGVMIYLQVIGTLFFAGLAFLICKLLRSVTDACTAQLAAIFFMMFRAKQTPFPDYANLQIAFSVLVFLCLVSFIREQRKKRYLFGAAFFLCLEVLAYPSCLLAYLPVVLFLFRKTEERGKNIGLFTGLCALFGGAYAGYFLLRMGFARFQGNLVNIFYADTHREGLYVSIWNYFSGLLLAVAWLVLCAGIAGILCRALRRRAKEGMEFLPVYGCLLFLSELFFLFARQKTGLDWTCTFYVLPPFLMALGCFAYSRMSGPEKEIWLIGSSFALCSFVSAWLLSDLGLITMTAYMVLGGVVSFIPLRHVKKQAGAFLFLVCALVVAHRGLVVWGYANKGNIWMVQDVETIVRSGPSKGVVCDYMTYYQITYDAEDHRQYVTADDSLFLVGGWLIDSLEYLLTEADISNYSTIDTPFYNEKLLDYLELYPEKRPTVVAVSCWYGDMQVPETSWIMGWVNENYETVGDGRYWRYYRAKELQGSRRAADRERDEG